MTPEIIIEPERLFTAPAPDRELTEALAVHRINELRGRPCDDSCVHCGRLAAPIGD
jgi:hypothetical protein